MGSVHGTEPSAPPEPTRHEFVALSVGRQRSGSRDVLAGSRFARPAVKPPPGMQIALRGAAMDAEIRQQLSTRGIRPLQELGRREAAALSKATGARCRFDRAKHATAADRLGPTDRPSWSRTIVPTVEKREQNRRSTRDPWTRALAFRWRSGYRRTIDRCRARDPWVANTKPLTRAAGMRPSGSRATKSDVARKDGDR